MNNLGHDNDYIIEKYFLLLKSSLKQTLNQFMLALWPKLNGLLKGQSMSLLFKFLKSLAKFIIKHEDTNNTRSVVIKWEKYSKLVKLVLSMTFPIIIFFGIQFTLYDTNEVLKLIYNSSSTNNLIIMLLINNFELLALQICLAFILVITISLSITTRDSYSDSEKLGAIAGNSYNYKWKPHYKLFIPYVMNNIIKYSSLMPSARLSIFCFSCPLQNNCANCVPDKNYFIRKYSYKLWDETYKSLDNYNNVNKLLKEVFICRSFLHSLTLLYIGLYFMLTSYVLSSIYWYIKLNTFSFRLVGLIFISLFFLSIIITNYFNSTDNKHADNGIWNSLNNAVEYMLSDAEFVKKYEKKYVYEICKNDFDKLEPLRFFKTTETSSRSEYMI